MSLMLSSKSNQQMQKPYCLQDSFETGGADGAMHIGIRKGMNAYHMAVDSLEDAQAIADMILTAAKSAFEDGAQ